MKYVFIERHQAEFSIKAMCRVLGVSRSGCYARSNRREQPEPHQQFRQQCDRVACQIFHQEKQRYDAPLITDELREQRLRYNIKTVAASLKRRWLRARAALKFSPAAVVQRTVIGRSMASRWTAMLVCDALRIALCRCKRPKNVIAHSDRGAQHCSTYYQTVLMQQGLRDKMSAKAAAIIMPLRKAPRLAEGGM